MPMAHAWWLLVAHGMGSAFPLVAALVLMVALFSQSGGEPPPSRPTSVDMGPHGFAGLRRFRTSTDFE